MSKSLLADCVAVAATDPLYNLYTFGTTGKPKEVMRDNGGHAVALKWSMKYLYDVKPGDLLGSIRCGMGCRAFIHRVHPSLGRLHDHPVKMNPFSALSKRQR